MISCSLLFRTVQFEWKMNKELCLDRTFLLLSFQGYSPYSFIYLFYLQSYNSLKECSPFNDDDDRDNDDDSDNDDDDD